MFEDSCKIRQDFLSNLKDILLPGDMSYLNDKNLPKKEGIFQHVPLYGLYKNKFFLPEVKVRSINKKQIEHKILEESLHSHIVFVNGVFEEDLSDISECDSFDISLDNSITCKNNNNFFDFLSRSSSKRKFVLKAFSDKRNLVQVLHVITDSSEKNCNSFFPLFNFNLNIVLGQNSAVDFCFTGVNLAESKKPFWLNQSINIDLEENSLCDVFYDYSDFNSSWMFNLFSFKQKRDSGVNFFAFSEGSLIENCNVRFVLAEENSFSNLYGLGFLKEDKQFHISILTDHIAENTMSDQLVKSVLQNSSRFGFESLVNIEKNAKKTKSAQLNKNLILDENAQVFSKPFLCVLNEDVTASHGSNVFQLSDEDIFYLMSRSLSKQDAKSLLVKGFCKEIIDFIKVKSLKEKFLKKLMLFLEQKI